MLAENHQKNNVVEFPVQPNPELEALISNWVYMDNWERFVKKNEPFGEQYTYKQFNKMYWHLKKRMPWNVSVKNERLSPSQYLVFSHRKTNRASDVRMSPGKEQVYFDKTFQFQVLNTWSKPKVGIAKGDVTVFKDFLLYLMDDNPEYAEFFTQWLAHAVRHPETKIRFAVLLSSEEKGLGKNVLSDCIMKPLVGEHNYKLLDNQKAITGDFDDWKSGTSFCLLDELHQMSGHKFANELKGLITNDTTRVNPKGKPEISIRNYINVMMFSNYRGAIQITENERRYFVVHNLQKKRDQQWFIEFIDWLNSGGLEAINHYFLHEVDLTSFDPNAPPIYTDDYYECIALGKSDLGEEFETLVENGTGLFSPSSYFTKSYLKKVIKMTKEFQSSDLNSSKFYVAAQQANLNLVGKLQKPNGKQVDLFTFGCVEEARSYYMEARRIGKHELWYDSYVYDGLSKCSLGEEVKYDEKRHFIVDTDHPIRNEDYCEF